MLQVAPDVVSESPRTPRTLIPEVAKPKAIGFFKREQCDGGLSVGFRCDGQVQRGFDMYVVCNSSECRNLLRHPYSIFSFETCSSCLEEARTRNLQNQGPQTRGSIQHAYLPRFCSGDFCVRKTAKPRNVTNVYAACNGFSAVTEDGMVVTWGSFGTQAVHMPGARGA